MAKVRRQAIGGSRRKTSRFFPSHAFEASASSTGNRRFQCGHMKPYGQIDRAGKLSPAIKDSQFQHEGEEHAAAETTSLASFLRQAIGDPRGEVPNVLPPNALEASARTSRPPGSLPAGSYVKDARAVDDVVASPMEPDIKTRSEPGVCGDHPEWWVSGLTPAANYLGLRNCLRAFGEDEVCVPRPKTARPEGGCVSIHRPHHPSAAVWLKRYSVKRQDWL